MIVSINIAIKLGCLQLYHLPDTNLRHVSARKNLTGSIILKITLMQAGVRLCFTIQFNNTSIHGLLALARYIVKP